MIRYLDLLKKMKDEGKIPIQNTAFSSEPVRSRYPDPPVENSPLIPRREAVQLINAAMVRISKVWSKDGSIEPDDSWHERVNEAAMWGTRGEFLAVIQEWEKSETARAKAAGEAV